MARNFNGTSDIIKASGANVWGRLTACSIAFWVNAAAQNNRNVYDESGANGTNIFFITSDSISPFRKISVGTFNGSSAQVRSVGNVFDSTWHHVAFCQASDGSYNLYIDGGLDSQGAVFMQSITGFDRATMGAGNRGSGAGTSSNFLTGSVAHLATWSRVLSANEVASLAAGLLPSHLAPSHYWPLWGSDSPEPDLVSGGIDGTLTGTTQGTGGGPPVGLSLITLRGSLTTTPMGAGAATVAGAASLTATGTLTAAGKQTAYATGVLTATGTLTGIATRTGYGAATLTAAGLLDAAGAQTAFGMAAITGAGSLAASGGRTVFGSSTLAGVGSISVSGGRAEFGIAALTGLGTLTAAGTVTAAPHVLDGDVTAGFIRRPLTGQIGRPTAGRIATGARGRIT